LVATLFALKAALKSITPGAISYSETSTCISANSAFMLKSAFFCFDFWIPEIVILKIRPIIAKTPISSIMVKPP
jgi:hypothetical protein